MKWIIGIYIGCVFIFIVGVSVLAYKVIAEVSQNGLESVIHKIWKGSQGETK